MTLENTFIKDILANPHNVGLRLIYADWLDEHDDPEQADFIRLQCELAEPDKTITQARQDCLRQREQKMLAAHGYEWAGAIRNLVRECHFHRGFIEEVRLISFQSLVLREALLFRLAPITTLNLSKTGIGRSEAKALASYSSLAQLRRLNLSGNFIGYFAIKEIARSPHLHGLEELDLSANRMGDSAVGVLAQSSVLTRLTKLKLRANAIGNGGARRIAGGRAFQQLRELDVSGNDLGSIGAHYLVRSARLAQLRKLNLSATGMQNVGAKDLATLSRLVHLKDLDLSRNGIGPEGAIALAKSAHLSNLRHLDLGNNHPEFLCSDDDQLDDPESYVSPQNLTRYWPTNQIGEQGASALAASPYLTHLESLGLTASKIGDQGVKAIARSPYLANLRVLNLGDGLPLALRTGETSEWTNSIGVEGVMALVSSPYLKNLRYLDLTGNALGEECSAGTELAATLYARFGKNVVVF